MKCLICYRKLSKNLKCNKCEYQNYKYEILFWKYNKNIVKKAADNLKNTIDDLLLMKIRDGEN